MLLTQKGGLPPFFLLHAPRLRDDTLLARAYDQFQAGHYADALITTEYLCRRYPAMHVPAVLRAKIIESCRPELTAKAWYQAWKGVPGLSMLQDAMLRCWLASGAADSVRSLGQAFLPERCRAGTHQDLLSLLRQAGVASAGACWKAGDAIEAMLFAAPGAPLRARLLLANEHTQYEFDVPADGRRFRLPLPQPFGVWSLALSGSDAPQQLLQGSPLVFAAQAPAQPPAQPAPAGEAPSESAQVAVRHAPPRPVDIVIPVYGDAHRTRSCIDSVLDSLRHNACPAAVLVVDDASPEPALSAWLDAQAAAGRLTLLRNPHNLGFIETCNRAMRLRPEHDIMLLNADTLVHGDWLDRLRATLYSAPDIASVTPWTNNGEISSFPKIGAAARGPTPAQLARIDTSAAALRRSGHTADLELPTCCGFAMLIKRSALDQVGLLDGVHLVRGYGEEVDWCLRANAAGYRHLLATGVFIAHTGTVSFRFEKTLRVQQNRAVLAARYPRYHADYSRFLNDDPLLPARDALKRALQDQRCDWLADAQQLLEGAAEVARAVPAALPASCMRIGVWQHRLRHPQASKVLALARLIASRPELSLRLLVIGEASEALWHTGVVDVLQSGAWDETVLLTDAAMAGMAGCAALLTQAELTTPLGIPRVELDASFDASVWLEQWLEQHERPAPARTKRKTKSKEAAAV